MPRPAQRSRLAALSLALASFVVLFACQDNIPSQPEFARVNTRYQLTIKGTGTTAGGSVVSDRGGISCTIQSNGGVQGKCSQGFKAGEIGRASCRERVEISVVAGAVEKKGH